MLLNAVQDRDFWLHNVGDGHAERQLLIILSFYLHSPLIYSSLPHYLTKDNLYPGLKLDTIRTALDSHNQNIATMESTLTTHSDELTKLTTRLDQLEKANVALAAKKEDLENRSRRQSLRVVGVPEGAEGGSPLDFVSQLLHKVIGDETFPKPPELDRAHRTPAPKPAQG